MFMKPSKPRIYPYLICNFNLKLFPLLLLLFCLAYILFLCIPYANEDVVNSSFFTLAVDSINASDSREPPVVLAWTSFFGYGMFEYSFLRRFDSKKCRYSCTFTEDKARYRNNASIVVLHARNIDINDLPPARPDLLKVFFIAESPYNSGSQYKSLPANYFNLSISYRRNSDIFLPYDSFQPIIPMVTDPQDIWQPEEVENKIKGKTKMLLQFVSNCKTSSGREKYVEQLKKFVEITDFGRCSGSVCSQDECEKQEIDKHMFYLAFENSICHQYTTEKFWKLRQLTVPIVLSRWSLDGLDIPADAYIAVEDFKSPEELAKHLYYLKNNPQEYLKYFSWTKKYTKIEDLKVHDVLCQLCKLATEGNKAEIVDIHRYWEKDGICVDNFVDKLLLT
uniref:Fucosyltransferase n=1 Tax=Ditylenchus dipsaci TaxID=166011 RepID=A0A915D296_9BILA